MNSSPETPVFTAKPGIVVPGVQAEYLADLDRLMAVIDQQADAIQEKEHVIEKKSHVIAEQKKRIALLEEYLRLERARLYGRSSEQSSQQGEIFNEAEMADGDDEQQDDAPDANDTPNTEKKRKASQGRKPLSPSLPRFQEKIELSPEEKNGAIDTFFTKVREELDIIPAKVRVKEVLQEKAVFLEPRDDHQRTGVVINADETRIQVLKEPDKSATSDKYMWVTLGGPPGQPAVLFHYDPSRSKEVPLRLFEGFKGYLQTDGYAGYNAVCCQEGITQQGCFDHARRKFVDAKKGEAKGGNKKKQSNPRVSKADVALGKIGKLYAIEADIQSMSVDQKQQQRQTRSVPLLVDLREWLEKNVTRVVPGSLIHSAMKYALNQWPKLVVYCEDGRLNISNAAAENAIWPFTVGRKNWLFADTPKGAKASAVYYSLIESAKANGLEPFAYLSHILKALPYADTVDKFEQLLPWGVKAAGVLSKNS